MRRLTLLCLLAAAAALGGCRKAKTPASTSQAVQACTSCHGTAGNAAPPRATTGATATTDISVGAHAAHLAPGPFRKAVGCDECHPVPRLATDPGHGDGEVQVVFAPSPIATITPRWNRGSATCSGTYCHGATLAGGTLTAPVWTRVDGSQVACGTCHGIPPPPSSGHPKVDASIPGFTATPSPGTPSTLAVCAACHPDTVRSDGSIDVQRGAHIDRVVELGAYACARCHGDPADTTRDLAVRPAPPNGTAGQTATTDRAVGAHLVHLTKIELTDRPIGCGECHAVPTSMLNHPKGRVDLSWGPLATAGGAAPSWNAGTLTCSSTYCHGSTLSGGTATAPKWTQVDGTQRRCTSCHGMPPATPAHAQDAQTNPTPTDCNRCHTGYSSTAVVKATHIDGLVNVDSGGMPGTCTTCHGDATRSPGFLRPAPPRAVGNSTDPTDHGVGAHLAHLTGNRLSATPVVCSECHPPQVRTNHASADSYVLQLRWGPLATAARSYPSYDAQALTCSSTYCHGSTLAGGTVTAPRWTAVTNDPSAPSSQVACGACHGIPPPAPHVTNTDCGTCHTGYTASLVNLALHINGEVDVSGGTCTTCHGDASRTPSTIAAAPPVEARLSSGTAPWAGDGASGAHLKHLVAGPLAKAIACLECHAKVGAAPAGGTDPHGDGKATLTFGSLARTDGATPTFDAATATCSNTYCHGSTRAGGTLTRPVWTKTDGSQVACGTCHAVPPADGTHDALANGASCGGCHDGYGGTKGGAAGSFTVNTAIHVDGTVNATGGTCTTCHGTKGRSLVAGADPQAESAPPVDAKGFTAAGAHLAHVNKASLMGAPVGCGECHPPVSAAPKGGTDTHGDGKATVVLGNRSKADNAVATFVAATATCASNYCHGATLSGGTNTAPVWTKVDGTQATCGTCHGIPPPAPHSPNTACGGCHPGYTATTVDAKVHIDGKVDASGGSCTSCHGEATRTPSSIAAAPPTEARVNGAPGPWAGDGQNGAHLKHLTGTSLGPVIACGECHTVPAAGPRGGTDTHGDGKATVVFGARARTGGATPAFSATAVSCSGVYCHGAKMSGGSVTTPAWTDGARASTCGACHGVPPADTTHNGLAAGAACKSCHTGYGGTKGGATATFTVNTSLHLNGVMDATGGTCTSCHGTEGRALANGADSQTASAPPASAAGFSTAGAHLAHLNKGTAAIGKQLACAECHAVPASSPKGGTDPHGDGKATVAFGNLSRTGGKSPSFNASNLTCSSTYCHGTASVRWDAGAQSCTACHALPPQDACHTGWRHEASGGRCNGCHRNTDSNGTSISKPAQHVDGVIQGQCNDCHPGSGLSCTNHRGG